MSPWVFRSRDTEAWTRGTRIAEYQGAERFKRAVGLSDRAHLGDIVAILNLADRGPIKTPPRYRRRRPRRLIQLGIGLATVVIGAFLTGRVLSPEENSTKVNVYDLRWKLPANALNVGGVVGPISLPRKQLQLVSLLRRDHSPHKRAESSGTEPKVALIAKPGDTSKPVDVKLVVDAELIEAWTDHTPATPVETVDEAIVEPPLPSALTDVDRFVRLEAMAPQLARQVDGFEWARLPDEWPLFRVFDETDPGVVPPGTKEIPLRDDLRVVWASGFQGDNLSQLEARSDAESGQVGLVQVTISERGEVERARLLSAPDSIHGSMLLSVVKAWKFSPATKDRVPVRYRQVIPILAAR